MSTAKSDPDSPVVPNLNIVKIRWMALDRVMAPAGMSVM